MMCPTRPMRRDVELEATIVEKYAAVEAFLDERGRRIWAATESRAIGYGGDAVVSDATGLSRPTIRKGRGELESGGAARGRIRRAGAGRPGIKQSQPGIEQALEKLVDPLTRGDPQSPLRWTCKSRAKLAAALSKAGWQVSTTTVGRLLHELGYRLQSVRKSREGASHPDRNAQFEHINSKADEFLQRAQPVVSVDTKNKELVGDFKNAGREWQPKGQPEKSLAHDFPQDTPHVSTHPYTTFDHSSHLLLEIPLRQVGYRGLGPCRGGRRRRFLPHLDAGDDPGRLPPRRVGRERSVAAHRHPPGPTPLPPGPPRRRRSGRRCIMARTRQRAGIPRSTEGAVAPIGSFRDAYENRAGTPITRRADAATITPWLDRTPSPSIRIGSSSA